MRYFHTVDGRIYKQRMTAVVNIILRKDRDLAAVDRRLYLPIRMPPAKFYIGLIAEFPLINPFI